MIDERFCTQLGTEKQHNYICRLASRLGHSTLRYVAADLLGCSVSKMSRRTVTMKEASGMIDALLARLKEQESEKTDP